MGNPVYSEPVENSTPEVAVEIEVTVDASSNNGRRSDADSVAE